MRTPLLSCCLILALLGCDSPPATQNFDPTIRQLVTEEQWKASNHNRTVFREDGFFSIPEGVKRVWIDVGAYKLRVTRRAMRDNPDLAIIAIEPMHEHWQGWPDNPRVIGVPVAISLERGMLEFNLNETDGTNSLLKTKKGGVFEAVMVTVDTRQVPGVRLEDVIERIPEDVTIGFVKTDIQGMDLQALKSAGERLRRVERVQTEIVNLAMYEKSGPESMSSEKEFFDHMTSMGFSLVGELSTPNREWLDAFYVNDSGDKQRLLERLGPGVEWPGHRPKVPAEQQAEGSSTP